MTGDMNTAAKQTFPWIFGRVATWLSICAVIAPLVTLFDGLAAAPIFVVSALMAVWCGWPMKPWRAMPKGLAVPFGITFVRSLVACAWTVTPMVQSLRNWAAFVVVTVLGLLATGAASQLDAADRTRIKKSLAIGVILAAAILLFETRTDYALTRHVYALFRGGEPTVALASMVSRGVVLLFLISCPALLAVYRLYGARGAVPLFVVLAVGVVGDGKHAIVLALAGGGLVFAATLLAPAVILRIFRVVAVAVILAMPLIEHVLPTIPQLGRSDLFNSARHRVVIWRFTIDHLVQHPWRGWGMDASREMPGADDDVDVTVVGKDGSTRVLQYANLPLHPHNGPLQIWLELGVPGALLLAAIIWAVIGNLMRGSIGAVDRATGAAAMAGGLVIGAVSFGVWQAWWLATIWLSAVLFASVAEKNGEPAR